MWVGDRRIAELEAAEHRGQDVAVTLMEMLPPSGLIAALVR
jgi:hypothetical protein